MAQAGAPMLNDAFGVIAHPLRRVLLERLAAGESRVTELAATVPVSRPAVSQHLRMMLEAGVVNDRRDGRERYYSLRREQLKDVERWLVHLDDFWAAGLRRLGEHLDGQS